VAKAEALVEATGGIFDRTLRQRPSPRRAAALINARMSCSPTPWPRAFGFTPIDTFGASSSPVGELELLGGKAPCPGRTDVFAVLFGDEPEIPQSLPADEIFGYARNRLRRLCIGFIGRHREKIPQYLEVILDSGTDHKIGHRTCL